MARRSGLGRSRSGGSQKASHSPRPPPPFPLLLPANMPSAPMAQQQQRVPLAEMSSGKVPTAEPAAAPLSPERKASGMTAAHEQQLVTLLAKRQQMGNAAPKEVCRAQTASALAVALPPKHCDHQSPQSHPVHLTRNYPTDVQLDDLGTLLETDGSVSSMNARQRRTMRRAIEVALCVLLIAAYSKFA